MDPKQALPEELKSRLNGFKAEGFARLDLREDGAYAASWLVLGEGELRLIQGEDSRSWKFSELKAVRTRYLTGNGFVLLKGPKGKEIEVGRFSQAAAEEVEALTHKLAKSLKMPGASDRPAPAPKRPCPKCGLAIPQGQNVCPVCFEKKKLFRLMLGLIQPYKWVWVASIGLSALVNSMDLFTPYLTGKILVDRYLIPASRNELPDGSEASFNRWVAVLFTLFVINAFLGGYRGVLIGRAGEKVVMDLRNKVYHHLQKLSLSYFHRKQTGWIISRVTSDTDRLQGFLQDGLPDILIDIVMLIMILAVMLGMHWKLAMGVLLPVPVAFFGIKIFGRKIEKIYHRAWRRFSLINSLLGDVIPGVKVIQVFAQEGKEKKRFEGRVQDAYDHNLKAVSMSSIYYNGIWSFFSVGLVAVWGWGGHLIIHHDPGLTPGTLVTFIGYMWRFYEPIHRLPRITNTFQRAMTSAERVFEMLEEKPEVAEPENPTRLPALEGRITFKNVHFRYKEGEPVLKGINLDVKPGEMIGLVGTSGAGKTTLVGLIPRFYDAIQGQVLVDGVDVREMSLQQLRSSMGMVLQDPFLFHGTIRDNIAYAEPKALAQDVIGAAEAANAHRFILRFQEAYDSQVGERGVLLSGGEKQRISIARAILHNPKILILDEATSSVDTETESQIQEAIFRLVKNRTTFVIAHRLSTLRRCDRILVVDKGVIAEMGSHDQLIARKKKYYKLCHMQSEMSRIKAL